MRNKKKNLKEAISKTVTPQEQQTLQSLDPALRNNILTVLDAARSRGRNLDINSAVKQTIDAFKMRGEQTPELEDFLHKQLTQQYASQPAQRFKNVPPPVPAQAKMQTPKRQMNTQGKVPVPPKQQSPQFLSNVPVAQVSKEPVQQNPEDFIPDAQTARSALQKDSEQVSAQSRDFYKRNKVEPPGAWEKIFPTPKQPTGFEDTMMSVPPNQIQQQRPNQQAKKVKKENKMIKNKQQLKEAIQRGLIIERRRAVAKNILKEEIAQQLKVKRQAQYFLSEGPLSNVWGKLKSAGTAVGSAMGGYAGLAKNSAQTDQQQRVKEVVGNLTKMISKVHQQRQKWNSQVLKSAEMMSQYHDAVVQMSQLFEQHKNFLGPAGEQIHKQIADAKHALKEDLMSEVSQIQAMLSLLGMKGESIDKLLKQHQLDSEEKREQFADANPAAVTSNQRAMPSVRGGKPTPKETLRKLRPESQPKTTKSKKEEDKDEDQKSRQRVQKTDKDVYKKYQNRIKEIDEVYQEMADDLSKRALKTKDPKERQHIVQQMYQLAKMRKEREREAAADLKGIGIRSKAGMTLLKKAYG